MENFNGFGFLASGEQVLWRLLESENEVAEEEDYQGQASQYDQVVAPAHVAGDGTASLSRTNSTARWQCGVAPPFRSGDSSVSDYRGDGDTERLPHGQECDKEAAVVRQKLESDGRVNGNVASQAERCEEVDGAYRRVVILWCGLLRS
jgi:hypothetical protein